MGSENNPALSLDGAGLNFLEGFEDPEGFVDFELSSPSAVEWRDDLAVDFDPSAIKSTP